jgi:hypothetical protein
MELCVYGLLKIQEILIFMQRSASLAFKSRPAAQDTSPFYKTLVYYHFYKTRHWHSCQMNTNCQNIIYAKWLQNRSTTQKVRELHFTSHLCIREIIYKFIIGMSNAKQTGSTVSCMGNRTVIIHRCRTFDRWRYRRVSNIKWLLVKQCRLSSCELH